MSDDSTTKKPQDRQQQLLKTVRQGAIAASIWKRRSSTGTEHLDFSLSRSWKLKSGDREGYSPNFFETNEQALHDVIAEACEFIREHGPAQVEEPEQSNPVVDEAA